MKKICSFLLIFAVIIHCSFSVDKQAFASESVVYAKVNFDCVLYKSQSLDSSIDNIYFVIPETYFVTILDSNENVYKVQYDKYIGYVKKDSVVIAKFIPNVKILEGVKCNIKYTSGTQVWSKPSTTGSVLTTIPAATENITYIAACYGEIPMGGTSNFWYYISYTPSTNSTNVYEGYIYSENVAFVSEIVDNLETNPEIIQEENIVEEKTIYVSPTFKTIITALISIPIILLISIILYKLIKFLRKNTNKIIFENKLNLKNNHDNCVDLNFKGFSQNENNFQSNQIKNEIDKMKNTSFVKMRKVSSNNRYPKFPFYESDDDLL